LGLKVFHELVVVGHQLAAFPFGEGNIQAVVDAAAHSRRDRHCPGQEGAIHVERDWGTENVGKEASCLGRLDETLPLGPGQGVSDFDGDNIWGKELVKPIAKIIAESKGFWRIGLGQDPLQRHGCIEDALHSSSRP
jgi:hypothetical protein